MDIESLREYCLHKKEVREEFPFGDSTLVFKVRGKIFLLAGLDQSPLQFNAKADPEKSIQPGYHMNKKHWNTVIVDGSIPEKILKQLVDESYALVVQSLPKKEREGLQG